VKYVENCEGLLFQRPDDAIKPGYDTIAEADIATPGHLLVQLRAPGSGCGTGDADDADR
jgi:hypothetical protein